MINNVKDAPTSVITLITLVLFFMVVILVSSAIIGVVVAHDFAHRADALFFTNPIRRRGFMLVGRHSGGMRVLLLTLLAPYSC